MKRQLLITSEELLAAQESDACIVIDCRFVLSDTGSGYRNYLEAHIPGAFYAHLDDDLSSPVTNSSGRHPLPAADEFAVFLARCGWQPGKKLVAYDDADGSIAARLWWLMKYFGYDNAALLDGGFSAWKAAGFELERGQVKASVTAPATFKISSRLVVSTQTVVESLGEDNMVLVDVRAGERFRGEIEPIDTVAGHVPGAVNYPFQSCVTQSGRFKVTQEIRKELQMLSGSHQPGALVFMCGSGVTACHTIFAAELAGLPGSKLYAGSWSEWIRDPSRTVVSESS